MAVRCLFPLVTARYGETQWTNREVGSGCEVFVPLVTARYGETQWTNTEVGSQWL